MKILFLSDIHGSATRLAQALDFFDSHACDILCLVGDLLNYGPRNGLPEGLDAMRVAEMLNERAGKIVAVRGNCDSEVDQMLLRFPMMADYALLADNDSGSVRTFFVTHGHKFITEGAPWLSSSVVVSGHTHVYHLTPSEDGTLHCNCGSITFPKQNRQPSFAFYDGRALHIVGLDGSILSSHNF